MPALWEVCHLRYGVNVLCQETALGLTMGTSYLVLPLQQESGRAAQQREGLSGQG